MKEAASSLLSYLSPCEGETTAHEQGEQEVLTHSHTKDRLCSQDNFEVDMYVSASVLQVYVYISLYQCMSVYVLQVCCMPVKDHLLIGSV